MLLMFKSIFRHI